MRGGLSDLIGYHIHSITTDHVAYYHLEGFWDCSLCVRIKYGLQIYTWVETLCIFLPLYFVNGVREIANYAIRIMEKRSN